ncbi:hypothetical protein [Sporosarcina highlanderae]|uniref:Uncharacterized protein n=1 Tax=Sporosarcina highlanderae TaxID=3035916 RepID=A0ABT8JRF7_9BACL|nr:hypothetical protein [Sporosarcina highlanderae]MDN4607680.1 hypothetical protein [Sporosarcina highlanderae]
MPKVINALLIAILIILLVVMSNQNANQASKVENLVTQNEELIVKIEDLNKDNQELNNKLKMGQRSDSPQEHPYIKPDFLQVDWDKVILETYDQEIVIDSKLIIEAFQNRFVGIVQTENPYPAGFPIEFTFHAFSGDQKYSFYSLENGFFMNTEMDTFYRSERDFTQLAKAYLSNPIGDLDEHLFSKLYNSGMVFGEKEFPFPVLDSLRIKGIASSFIAIKKEEMDTRPAASDYTEKFSFYYFGDIYEMTLYDEYIHVSDKESTFNLWYKATKEDINSILMVLTAG